MIIGYDFWGDGIYHDADITPIIEKDNDGVAFDTCNPLNTVNDFTLKGGTFDELHITKDIEEIENRIDKDPWGINTVLLAKFQGNLSAGTLSVNGCDISQIEVRRRKKGEENWQSYFTINYISGVTSYSVVDKFIEAEETYEYCLRPMTLDEDGNEITGMNSTSAEIYITYDHAHIFDNTASYNFVYNLKFGNITNQISANTIETLGSPYPYVVYGESNYLSGSIECLLVSEESAVGNVDIKSEKILRNNILSFLNNKKPKIIKNSDGIYMLIEIVGTPTLTPTDNLLGVYQVSFDYVQVGDVNNIETLSDFNFEFNYNGDLTDNVVLYSEDKTRDWMHSSDANFRYVHFAHPPIISKVYEGCVYKLKIKCNNFNNNYNHSMVFSIRNSNNAKSYTETAIYKADYFEVTFTAEITGVLQFTHLQYDNINASDSYGTSILELILIDVPRQITKSVGSE